MLVAGCKPDCTFRDCGPDGCGGSCGNCNGTAICNRVQQCSKSLLAMLQKLSCDCAVIVTVTVCTAGQVVYPSASTALSPSPTAVVLPSPIMVQRYQTASSTVAGAFFGGFLAAAVIGGTVYYLATKRRVGAYAVVGV